MLIFATFLIIFRNFCGLKLVWNKDGFEEDVCVNTDDSIVKGTDKGYFIL